MAFAASVSVCVLERLFRSQIDALQTSTHTESEAALASDKAVMSRLEAFLLSNGMLSDSQESLSLMEELTKRLRSRVTFGK